MKATAVKGTNDYLPREAALRDYLQSAILQVYQNSGFERIMTPAIEDAENLDKSEGGDNLNLIFKILKRGEKLTKALEGGNSGELADLGLRYDLTLPLSRYYAANRAKLLLPVKCIQIDKVYRAERPQKGRLRQFVQCDIDIIGSSSPCCEVELIATTAKALLAIGIGAFTVRVNDRRLLRGSKAWALPLRHWTACASPLTSWTRLAPRAYPRNCWKRAFPGRLWSASPPCCPRTL